MTLALAKSEVSKILTRIVMNDNQINPASIKKNLTQLPATTIAKCNNDVLNSLLDDVRPVYFPAVVYPEVQELMKRIAEETDKAEMERVALIIKRFKVTERQKYVVIIEQLLEIAAERRWGICKNATFTFLYNGCYWNLLDREVLQKFLGDSAERMDLPKYEARQYTVRENLYKQFLVTGFLPMPDINDKLLINLRNGTFEIGKDGKGWLREFDETDFLKYQLPFDYDPKATCPLFHKYLDVSLPDKESQNVLAEFVGYAFAPHLKLEKALFLYGNGRNGKSVFYDIVTALMGVQNVSCYSIDSLCDSTGYYRAMIANKLVNYSSEVGKKINADIYKQLCSGEAVEARLPYGDPFLIRNYARLIFNANTLPPDPEQTKAYYDRFLIIPFTVTIPTENRDIDLAKKIINSELSGVFNWVLEGLDRVIRQKGFSECKAAEIELERYRAESDSVQMFIEECDYKKSTTLSMLLKDLYTDYRCFCLENGYRICSLKTVSGRLKNKGFEVIKGAGARIILIEKIEDGRPL